MASYNYIFKSDTNEPAVTKHLISHTLRLPRHAHLAELTSAHGNPLAVHYCPTSRSIAFGDLITRTGLAFKVSDADKLIAAINEASRREDVRNG